MKGFPPSMLLFPLLLPLPPSSPPLLPAPSHLWCLAIEPRTLYPLSTQCISALLPQQGAVFFFYQRELGILDALGTTLQGILGLKTVQVWVGCLWAACAKACV